MIIGIINVVYFLLYFSVIILF